MLTALSIRNVVLIERLDLTFQPGLCVLTGETGAGKSILLDALGLALGARADAGLLRRGGGDAMVSASFEIAPDHPANALLAANGLDAEDVLVLRRTLNDEGRSRAFVNDQATSVAFLKQLGQTLLEIQGQFAQRGLLDGQCICRCSMPSAAWRIARARSAMPGGAGARPRTPWVARAPMPRRRGATNPICGTRWTSSTPSTRGPARTRRSAKSAAPRCRVSG